MKKENKLSILTNGIIKENPLFVLMLGICPALALSSSTFGALGMGLAVLVVLICSNVILSALRNIIPDQVRIPAYIVIVAGLVTVVELMLKAYLPMLSSIMGVYLPLIAVNCLILGRAKLFARKNTVFSSLLDGIGMGVGFTLALVLMGIIREILGAGSIFGVAMKLPVEPITVFSMSAGGFMVFGLLMALVNKIGGDKETESEGTGWGYCEEESPSGRTEKGGSR